MILLNIPFFNLILATFFIEMNVFFLFNWIRLIFHYKHIDWVLGVVFLFKFWYLISVFLDSAFKFFKLLDCSFVVWFCFFKKLDSSLCIFVRFWRNDLITNWLLNALFVESLPAVTVWENNYNFAIWLVFDKVPELCFFVRTDVHTLPFLLVFDIMTTIETTVIPNGNSVTIFLWMLELPVVQSGVCQEPFNKDVVLPLANQLLLFSGQHTKSLLLVLPELAHKLDAV